MKAPQQPIILIGAARSGTKLVRDIIASHPEVGKVPYDVNYIWRLGNERLTHDELTPDLLTPMNKFHIRRQVEAFGNGKICLIEKTVSNCLRVPFVSTIFPEAKYIHLVRNGEDAIESAYRQWIAPTDWKYILKKAESFPLLKAPGYAFGYAKRILGRLLLRDRRKLGTWGPRYRGIDEDVITKDLIEVCSIQWARSVEKAIESLSEIPSERVHHLNYESFVTDPQHHLQKIARFCGIDPEPYCDKQLLQQISQGNIGRGRKSLSADQYSIVQHYVTQTMCLPGYSFQTNSFDSSYASQVII